MSVLSQGPPLDSSGVEINNLHSLEERVKGVPAQFLCAVLKMMKMFLIRYLIGEG